MGLGQPRFGLVYLQSGGQPALPNEVFVSVRPSAGVGAHFRLSIVVPSLAFCGGGGGAVNPAPPGLFEAAQALAGFASERQTGFALAAVVLGVKATHRLLLRLHTASDLLGVFALDADRGGLAVDAACVGVDSAVLAHGALLCAGVGPSAGAAPPADPLWRGGGRGESATAAGNPHAPLQSGQTGSDVEDERGVLASPGLGGHDHLAALGEQPAHIPIGHVLLGQIELAG